MTAEFTATWLSEGRRDQSQASLAWGLPRPKRAREAGEAGREGGEEKEQDQVGES